jgi:hypothetical protein
MQGSHPSPQPDLNLGITTYVNAAPMNPVQLDTSAAATDTIQYVATLPAQAGDQNGLTSTSTRTVIIQAADAPSIVPWDNASSPSNFPFPVAGRAVPYSITSSKSSHTGELRRTWPTRLIKSFVDCQCQLFYSAFIFVCAADSSSRIELDNVAAFIIGAASLISIPPL